MLLLLLLLLLNTNLIYVLIRHSQTTLNY